MTIFDDWRDGAISDIEALHAIASDLGEIESQLAPLETERQNLRDQLSQIQPFCALTLRFGNVGYDTTPLARRRGGRQGSAVRCPRVSAGQPIPTGSFYAPVRAAARSRCLGRLRPTRHPWPQRSSRPRRLRQPSPDRSPDVRNDGLLPPEYGRAFYQ